jgi:hypothetical protein
MPRKAAGPAKAAARISLDWDDGEAVVIGRNDISDFNDENILPELQLPEI